MISPCLNRGSNYAQPRGANESFRLVVKEILVSNEAVVIRHSTPALMSVWTGLAPGTCALSVRYPRYLALCVWMDGLSEMSILGSCAGGSGARLSDRHLQMTERSSLTTSLKYNCVDEGAILQDVDAQPGTAPTYVRDRGSQQLISMSRDMLLNDFGPLSVTRTVSLTT